MISVLKRHNFTFPGWAYWILFGVIGFLIIVNEENFQESEWYAVTVLSYFFLLFLAVTRWIFRQIKEILILRKQRAKMESLHLQSQVNPHFFFNTLNNLYGWVGKDPKQAQEMILKLSDMMRYSIYEGQADYVSLEKEIDYLNKYIELHKLRYLKSINVTFEVDVEDMSVGIRPLLFIILVENAFKHGVENLRNDAFVKVNLISNNKMISFSVENNFDPDIEKDNVGIGLANLEQRLRLTYPKNHKFQKQIQGDVYKTTLTINLK